MVPLNIYDAINFSKNAWNSVSQQTISNCWNHTGILPQNEMNEMDDEIDFDDQTDDEMEIQELIDQLPFNDPMSVKDFLYVDNCLKSNEGLTDDEIVSIVKSKNNEPEADLNEELLEVISRKDALDCLDNLVLFFEYSSDISINLDELNVLQKLKRRVLTSCINNAKQTTLDSFIQ